MQTVLIHRVAISTLHGLAAPPSPPVPAHPPAHPLLAPLCRRRQTFRRRHPTLTRYGSLRIQTKDWSDGRVYYGQPDTQEPILRALAMLCFEGILPSAEFPNYAQADVQYASAYNSEDDPYFFPTLTWYPLGYLTFYKREDSKEEYEYWGDTLVLYLQMQIPYASVAAVAYTRLALFYDAPAASRKLQEFGAGDITVHSLVQMSHNFNTRTYASQWTASTFDTHQMQHIFDHGVQMHKPLPNVAFASVVPYAEALATLQLHRDELRDGLVSNNSRLCTNAKMKVKRLSPRTSFLSVGLRWSCPMHVRTSRAMLVSRSVLRAAALHSNGRCGGWHASCCQSVPSQVRHRQRHRHTYRQARAVHEDKCKTSCECENCYETSWMCLLHGNHRCTSMSLQHGRRLTHRVYPPPSPPPPPLPPYKPAPPAPPPISIYEEHLRAALSVVTPRCT